MLRFWKNLAFFLLGLACTAAVLYPIAPRDRPVLERALRKRESCEVLLVGPSYIASGIHAAVFEDESRRLGRPLTLCKYGQPGLMGFEVRHVLELLLSHRWPKLKYLLVDITLGERIGNEGPNWFKPRVVDWHKLETLPWVYRAYESRRGSIARWVPTLWSHFEQMLMNYLGIGRGLFPLERLGQTLDSHPEEHEEEDDEGEVVVERQPKRRRAPEREGNVADEVAALLTKKAQLRAAQDSGSAAWPKELTALVRSLSDVELIFLISPVLSPKKPVRGASESPGRLVVFDFNDPARYPALYTPDVRGYTSHLRGSGPRIYSEELVKRLLEYEQARAARSRR